jgi:hypothetical protein
VPDFAFVQAKTLQGLLRHGGIAELDLALASDASADSVEGLRTAICNRDPESGRPNSLKLDVCGDPDKESTRHRS